MLPFAVPNCLLPCPQVALYALAALEQQQEQQQPEASYSSRRQQQQQDRLPSLPPVALVRLPGKVSSIAWSPDMDGVMSIGDYDGTLTQVRGRGVVCTSGVLSCIPYSARV